MITAVGGHGGYSGGKQFVTAEDLREKLSHLRNAKALIVKLVNDIFFMLFDWTELDNHTALNDIGIFVLKIGKF
jgi:nitric-oxide synthase